MLSVMTQEEMTANKERFISYCKEYVGRRDGLDRFLAYLEESDFFQAPSSTNYHLNEAGGLCRHSINVFETARDLYEKVIEPKRAACEAAFSEPIPMESIAIATLFHDVCKMKMYHATERWKKDENGRWQSYAGYEVRDDFPFGHGEKSCFIIERFMRLKGCELLAIRWHMGMFDVPEQGANGRYSLRAAMENEPLVTIVQAADVLAANCLEVTTRH